MLDWLRKVAERVNETDRDLVRRSAAIPRTPADTGLKRLSNSANHSVLWLIIAAGLASRKGVTRRGALRGIAAIGGASALTNLVGKPLFPRRRPAAELVPRHRRLSDRPNSSSFPSGHAASAFAFASAVALEAPRAGLVIAPIAIAVAYSRVHTGVHWPSDVVVGAGIGAGVALATLRWWPRRPDKPAQAPEHSAAPALDSGAGMLVLVNPDSGTGDGGPVAWIRARWPEATLFRPTPETDLITEVEQALDSKGSAIRALGVAGGDGTVASLASVASRRGLPLAVISAGTLNHFAKDLGIEQSDGVVTAVTAGTAVSVDLGSVSVDDNRPRCFINTSSLGGYPDMVRYRERWERRWGKWPAAAAALTRVLRQSIPMAVEIDGAPQRVWALFVGNGSYRPRGFAPRWRPRMDNGLLDVRYIRADVPFSRLRFVLAACTGALHRSRTYVQLDRRELEVVVHGVPVSLATDGEVGPSGNRFRFAARDRALSAYRPE